MAAPNPILLHHATLQKHVDNIKRGIQLDRSQPRTDFCRPANSFYLTDDYDVAKKILIPEVTVFTPNDLGAIMTFSLNLEGLKVKDFTRAMSGDDFKEWSEYVDYCRKFVKRGNPDPPPHRIVNQGYDVIQGWMSTKSGGSYVPICIDGTYVWQYAILTDRGVSALKSESVEYITKREVV